MEKSATTISSQCRVRNSFQVVFQFGSWAGSILCRFSISVVVMPPLVIVGPQSPSTELLLMQDLFGEMGIAA
jgi:hypothetical protein